MISTITITTIPIAVMAISSQISVLALRVLNYYPMITVLHIIPATR